VSLKCRLHAVLGEMTGFIDGSAAGILLIDDPLLRIPAAYGPQRESPFIELLAEAG
jgi:hypothetical protein